MDGLGGLDMETEEDDNVQVASPILCFMGLMMCL